MNKTLKQKTETGSALIYILIAIALLAALTIAFMDSSGQQTQNQNTFRTQSDLEQQVDFIRSAVQECVLTHSRGDNTIVTTGGGATDAGANRAYPIKPNSTHFTGATIGAAANRNVANIRCPGDPGDDQNHAMIFGGTSGKFFPATPSLFNDWQWYNGDDGVFFWISTTKSDAFLKTALEKLDAKYADCEASYIDATGGAVDMDFDSPDQATCAAGSLCFRVFMIRNASAVPTCP